MTQAGAGGRAPLRRCAWAAVASLTLTVHAATPAPANDASGQRVEGLLRQLTPQEKYTLLGGVDYFNMPGIARLGIPVLTTSDGPMGVRSYRTPGNILPGGIALAATWDTAFAESFGRQIGRDARARGVHFWLAPGLNITRSPTNGRNFEYFGEDPYLAGRMGVNVIRGVQDEGVAATAKHFLGNNSEFARHTVDVRIDERTLREIYLPAFEAAVREGHVAAVMDSYNLVNGEHMSENRRLNVDLLKREWGFSGILMSDWGGTYDTLGAANGGLDLEMPSGRFLNAQALAPLVASGKVSQATIDDKVRRRLRTMVRFGWLDHPQLDATIPTLNAAAREAALTGARESMVLLKNDGALLPLDRTRIRTLLVLGPDAWPAVPTGGGSAVLLPFATVSVLEGISRGAGTGINVQYARGIPDLRSVVGATRFTTTPDGAPGIRAETFDNMNLSGTPAATRIDATIMQGEPLDSAEPVRQPPARAQSTRWTGYYTPVSAGVHDIVVRVAGFARTCGYRLFVDDRLVADRWDLHIAPLEGFAQTLSAGAHKLVLEYHTGSDGLDPVPVVWLAIRARGQWVDESALALAARADAVVLATGYGPDSESEGWDRTFALPPGQEELIRRVAAVNRHVVVTVTAGGASDMSPWLDEVPAVLQTWYAGEEGGSALSQVLFGDVDASGRLPVTFERRAADNPAYDSYHPGKDGLKISYREGVFVGYRGYQQRGVKPLFPFGYGLSYSTFHFSGLQVSPDAAPGHYTVSFDVTNTGARAGVAVPQLYIAPARAPVARPPLELKGFTRVSLASGEKRHLTLPIGPRAFAWYGARSHGWQITPGTYGIRVGDSSAHILLSADLTVPGGVRVE
ncbi:MAG: glycoside hydrolase family 3 C-terminal domain-containing protein [Proteobacteria bacterium]|nr:glycoside hydrolase family 3 C-terminal domain-containing protein [Pseudomonadota bacterium]